MTRLAFCADIHIGNHKRFGGPTVAGMNTRCGQALGAFAAALRLAQSEKCEWFVVCGDLFDTSKPEPQLLAAVLDILRSNTDSGAYHSTHVIILLGNHDMHSTTPGDHALGCLTDHALVITAPTVVSIDPETDLLCVPFRPGEPAKDWLPDTVARMIAENTEQAAGDATASKRLLAVHMGIADADTPTWLANAPDSIVVDDLARIMDTHGIAAAMAGNWHDGCTWAEEPEIFQLGALVPTGWDNPGLAGYGGVLIYNTRDLTWHKHEVPGPRFLKLKAHEPLPSDPRPQPAMYVRVEVPHEHVPAHEAVLRDMVEKKKIAAYDIDIDHTAATAMAKTAAHVARSAETFTEALDAFLRTMPIPEKIERVAVAARVCAFMGK